jgi:predicted HicB family RNase H-like nuclease
MYFLTVPIADPKLHAAIKTSAAREGMKLKDWVVDSLRAALHPSDKKDLERK